MDELTTSHPLALSGNALKLLAAIAMLIDHIAYIFVPDTLPIYYVMRMIGRITAPIFFYFVSEGYRRTANKNRYTLRLLFFALISYLPYLFAFYGLRPIGPDFMRLNVIYTILIGLCAIRVRHEVKHPLLRTALIVALFFCAVPGDWGAVGFIILMIFDVFHDDFKKAAFCYSLFIGAYFGFIAILLSPVQALLGWGSISAFTPYHMSNAGMFLPLFLLALYRGEKGRGGRAVKWGFYVFYPLHLLILAAINVIGR